MTSEFAERHEAPPTPAPDADPAVVDDGWGPESAHGFEQSATRDDDAISKKLGETAVRGVERDDTAKKMGGTAIKRAESDDPAITTPETIATPETDALSVRHSVDGTSDDGWGRKPADVAPEDASRAASEPGATGDTPVPADSIAERTTANRIDLADNVHAIGLKETYDGYLDVVMHGDEGGTQAYIDGRSVDFTLAQTAELIESSPSWKDRPIRLLSCSTGRETYAQELADKLDVPVYAPNGLLEVADDGRTYVDSPDGIADGSWRRFEPGRNPAE